MSAIQNTRSRRHGNTVRADTQSVDHACSHAALRVRMLVIPYRPSPRASGSTAGRAQREQDRLQHPPVDMRQHLVHLLAKVRVTHESVQAGMKAIHEAVLA